MSITDTYAHFWRWGFWFRIRGFGFSVVQSSQFPPLFSERNGYRKTLRFAGFRLCILTPNQ